MSAEDYYLPALNFEHGDWVERAACRGLPTAMFHPVRGEDPRPAKATCKRCPVAEDCLDFALRNNIRCGIWGGLTEKDRRSHRRARGLLARPNQLAPHQRRAIEAAAMQEAS